MSLMSATNQINSATSSSPAIGSISKHRGSDPVQFVICNSCFWCTSLLFGARFSIRIDECPCCKSDMIESMPIESDEEYLFHENEKSGVTLEFRSMAEVGKEGRQFR